jgi:adenosine deaminase
MKDMAAKRVMVEINLTSNGVILGIKGKDHPFSLYRKFGVPMALSTDDEGVSRIDLTNEYVRAVESYYLSYADLKHLVRKVWNTASCLARAFGPALTLPALPTPAAPRSPAWTSSAQPARRFSKGAKRLSSNGNWSGASASSKPDFSGGGL